MQAPVKRAYHASSCRASALLRPAQRPLRRPSIGTRSGETSWQRGCCLSSDRESDWTATIKPAGPPRCPTFSLDSSFSPTVSAQNILESLKTAFSLLNCIHLQAPISSVSRRELQAIPRNRFLPPTSLRSSPSTYSRLTCRISHPGPVHRFHPGYNDSCSCASPGHHA